MGGRVGARRPARQDDHLVPGRGQLGGQVMHVPTEPADHDRRVLPRHHQNLHADRSPAADSACGRQAPRVQTGNSPSAVAHPAARRVAPADCPAPTASAISRMAWACSVRAVAGVPGGGVLADHERPVARTRSECLAQQLVVDPVAQFRAAPGARFAPRALSTVSSAGRTTSALSSTRSATWSPAHTRQSLPEPQRSRSSCTGSPTKPFVAGIGQGADADARLGQRAQHLLEPLRTLVPPVPEQFGVESGDHQARACRSARTRRCSRARTVSTKSATSRSTAAAASSGS